MWTIEGDTVCQQEVIPEIDVYERPHAAIGNAVTIFTPTICIETDWENVRILVALRLKGQVGFLDGDRGLEAGRKGDLLPKGMFSPHLCHVDGGLRPGRLGKNEKRYQADKVYEDSAHITYPGNTTEA